MDGRVKEWMVGLKRCVCVGVDGRVKEMCLYWCGW